MHHVMITNNMIIRFSSFGSLNPETTLQTIRLHSGKQSCRDFARAIIVMSLCKAQWRTGLLITYRPLPRSISEIFRWLLTDRWLLFPRTWTLCCQCGRKQYNVESLQVHWSRTKSKYDSLTFACESWNDVSNSTQFVTLNPLFHQYLFLT